MTQWLEIIRDNFFFFYKIFKQDFLMDTEKCDPLDLEQQQISRILKTKTSIIENINPHVLFFFFYSFFSSSTCSVLAARRRPEPDLHRAVLQNSGQNQRVSQLRVFSSFAAIKKAGR